MSDPTPALSSFLPTTVRGRGVVGRAGDGELGECLEAYDERILDPEVSGILKQTDRRLVFHDGDHVVCGIDVSACERARSEFVSQLERSLLSRESVDLFRAA